MIIPFFIMYQGCPNRCIFCNVHKIAGNNPESITEKSFRETIHKYLSQAKRKTDHIQIAFYGGNFTGMKKERQAELLKYAHSFIHNGQVHDIRISTRPDNIDNESLELLKCFGVSTVEIGAQSFVDEVLKLSHRGHSSSDVINAMNMLKDRGFKTGIHIMLGLPGDNRSGYEYSVRETITLKPDMVRIHPTIVFQGTGLAELFIKGAYTPLSISEAIDMCTHALGKFAEAQIPVIRLGLQTNREMETAGSIIAGPYHPAFRSLVEESIFFDLASSLLAEKEVAGKEITFILSPKDESSFRGQRNRNLQLLKNTYRVAGITVKGDHRQEEGAVFMAVEGRTWKVQKFSKPEKALCKHFS
jgi:histone acetyltransferase (RNA polymerase elongator complex component)